MKTTFSFFAAAAFLLAPVAHAQDLVPFASTWGYLHPLDGVDPALADTNFDTTWMLPTATFATAYDGLPFGAVDTATYQSGTGAAPIGYGQIEAIDGPLGGFGTLLTAPPSGSRGTAYFRHDFTLGAAVDNLALEIVADDGAVIYLDGAEIARVNFPGADTYGATSVFVGDEVAVTRFLGGLGGLAAGDHTIAISLHQVGTDSSDLGFDLRLSDEGSASPPIGTVRLAGEAVRPLLTAADPMGWRPRDATLVSITGGLAGIDVTLRSETVDLTAAGDVQFSIVLAAEEISSGTNFETDDTLRAFLELGDGLGGTTVLPLTPFGLDLDGDGTLNGEEFAPGLAGNFASQFARRVAARVPASAASVTLVVESSINSASETFILGGALLEDAPAATDLGTNELGAPVAVPVAFGPDVWTETAPLEFSLNGAGITGTIISEEIDLTGAPATTAVLTLNARETSTTSNFDAGDSFQAYVEIADAAGLGGVVELVNGGADTSGNNVISDEEFAPGVDFSEQVDVTFQLAAALPPSTVRARFVVLGFNDSASEFFTISGVKLVPAPPDIRILAINEAGGEFEVTWESEAGETYDLQFSPDLSNGSWTTVETVVASGATASTSHAANSTQAFYRIVGRL